jgi:Transglycosylase SLT domain
VRLRLLALGAALCCLGPTAEGQIYTRRSANGVVEATNVPEGPGFRLAYVGKGTLIHSRGFRRAYRGEFDTHIQAAAAMHGVAVDLIKAVIQVESEFDPFAVSSKGAQGLMQLMPFTARRFGVFDPFDARQNIFGGTQYLRVLLDMFQGNVALAVAGYNAGENAVARYKGIPPYRETRGYVQKIQSLLGDLANPLQAMYYAATPRGNGAASLAAPAAPSARRGKLVPARPRVYYKWTDSAGTLHVAHEPPGEGVSFFTIRALD